jgi:hypothetical protein
MKRKLALIIGLVMVLALVFAAAVLARVAHQADAEETLVAVVRQATDPYHDVAAAEAAGYGLFHGCVSSPTEGAMGVHLVNGDLVGDGALDAANPEAMLYEYKNGRMNLVGVEYVVIADAWHETNEGPPVLAGQLFNYVTSPNRYGIPAFYELHVWAWKRNPLGMFADFNPRVLCNEYTAESGSHTH